MKSNTTNTGLYTEILQSLLDRELIATDSSILVGCAGSFDDGMFQDLGFTNVTLSNLAPDQDKLRSELHFPVLHLDIEDLASEDESYDWVVVHAGLHHCANPAAALLEMYRVAKLGILAMEPIDSGSVSLAMKLGICARYEVGSVTSKRDNVGGGLRYGGIPNLIYRFKKQQIYQIIQTAHPEYEHDYLYWPRLVVPWWRLFRKVGVSERGQSLVKTLALPFCRIPFMANNLGFVVLKPTSGSGILQPWLERLGDGEIRMK